MHAAAESLGVTPFQVCLARPLHRAPNVLLIPGTADVFRPEADMAVGEMAPDTAALTAPDAIESRSGDVSLG
ncbi:MULTISPECIES: hypothetical protein [unclassified Streptomyces]|uniref:hypothetical protein n=1 Tax=unclassified Streptomyces TaxID=2593676 RepID=UPI00371D1E95